ncbi:MAG: hypothetical protein AAGA50_21640 [Pseudomonadota bacterium]
MVLPPAMTMQEFDAGAYEKSLFGDHGFERSCWPDGVRVVLWG